MPDTPAGAGAITAPAAAPLTIRDYIRKQSESLGIPADLALAIVDTESGGQHAATSRVGAKGFFQLMPETAKDLGVDPADPFQNIDGGLKYFKQQLDSHGGDVRLALAAYNAGPAHKSLAAGQVPAIPETQDYVMKVLRTWQGGGAGQPAAAAPAAAKTATPPPAFATAGMQPASPTGPKQQPSGNLFEQTIAEPIAGFGKGVGQTLSDVGSLAERATGLSLPDLPMDTTARTTGEKVGKFAEQTAEYALPAAEATKISKAAGVTQRLIRLGWTPSRARLAAAALEGGLQAGPAATIASVHGDDPKSTAVISAALPVVGELVTSMAPAIRKTAITKMARYFERGVTKNITEKVEGDVAQAASDFIDLPLQRTWRRTAKMTGKTLETSEKDLEAGLAGPFGDTPVPISPVYKELDNLVAETEHMLPVRSDAGVPTGELRTKDPTDLGGGGVVGAVGKLKEYLSAYQQAYGDQMPARQLHDVKAVWWKAIYKKREDTIVTSTGELLTTAHKEAMMRGGRAIMKVLENDAPKISELDTAVNHAANLNRFVQNLAGLERKGTLASKGARYAASGIGGAVGGTGGFLAGSAAGHPFIGASIGGHIGYATGKLLLRAVTSPRWRFMSQPVRRELASALAAGRAEQVRKIVTPLVLSATASSDNLVNQSSSQPSTISR